MMAKDQEKKDKTILDWFSGSNPNRQKVRKAIEKRKKKKKKVINSVSKKYGM